MVQRTGFEPAKHYALGPHPSPFDHSGTSALGLSDNPIVFQNPGSSVNRASRLSQKYGIANRHRPLFNHES